MTTTTWVQTYSGGRIDCNDIESSKFDLVDIMTGLANQPRFAGQHDPDIAWSVLHHTVLASYMCENHYHPSEQDSNLAAYAMLHDASEAYLGDMATPWKRVMPDYCYIEKRMQAAIFKQFGVKEPAACAEVFKHYDEQAMLVEAQHLSIDTHDWGITVDIELCRAGAKALLALLGAERKYLVQQSVQIMERLK